MFERIIDRVSDRIMIIREKCRAIVNTDNMPTITIIGVLAVFVIAAAVFIYADPNGRITSRPSKVDHVTIADASYDSVSLRWKAYPLANRYIIYRSARYVILFFSILYRRKFIIRIGMVILSQKSSVILNSISQTPTTFIIITDIYTTLNLCYNGTKEHMFDKERDL